MSATLALPIGSAVLVHTADDPLSDEIVSLLVAAGHDARRAHDELELRQTLRAGCACVLVVDVSSVSEETLDHLSAEGRVPRVVVFSAVKKGDAPRLPFRPDVLRAAVQRALRADEEPGGPETRRQSGHRMPDSTC